MRLFSRSISWMLSLVVALGFNTVRSQGIHVYSPRTFVLWNDRASSGDSLDQLAFERTLSSVGFTPLRIGTSEIRNNAIREHDLLVAPRGSALLLSAGEAEYILHLVSRGLALVTDGENPLASAIGLGFAAPIQVSGLIDEFRPDVQAFWSDSPFVSWFSAIPARDPIIAYRDGSQSRPLAVILKIDKGRCLCFSTLFDARTGRGYGRFPTLPDIIINGLGRTPMFIRRGADAYFDAGYRVGVSPDSLAAMWRRWGIRAVHAAAWYAYDSIPYDYRGLIHALHRSGILVYAWLEWPYIGKGFWDQHAGWRQKNALGNDAHLDFLYLMDLQNPACMRTAITDLKKLLALDWDGVDVAEFTLTGAGREALEGPARPDFFTGFTNVNREEFRKRSGFDPREFFDRSSPHYWRIDTLGLKSFYNYRTDVNEAIQNALFSTLQSLNITQRKSWELIFTIVDNSLHPEFDDLLGFSLEKTLSIVKKFHMTLNVEDPYVEWLKPPERYRSMGGYYQEKLSGQPFMIDINVVPMMPDRAKGFSTPQPAGTDFLQLWSYAAKTTSRICFYCEATIARQDWLLLPFAMAGGATAATTGKGLTIDAPRTVLLHVDMSGAAAILDGHRWPAWDDSEVIIPAGKHRLQIVQEPVGLEGATMRLLAINGELIRARHLGKKLEISYDAPSRCIMTLSRNPSLILVDRSYATTGTSLDGTRCILIVPPGKHRVSVE